MGLTSIYLKFTEHSASERSLWEHAANGSLNDLFWLTFYQLSEILSLQPPWITSVVMIELIVSLIASYLYLGCVNYNNVSQGLIHITEDKLHVILLKYEGKNKKFYSWTTPLGIFITCLIATITASFNETWGLSSDTWKAIFIIISLCSGIWLLYSGIRALRNKNDIGIEKLIEEIKNQDVE